MPCGCAKRCTAGSFAVQACPIRTWCATGKRLLAWTLGPSVDNAIFFGTNKQEVRDRMERARAAVEAAGLPTHEVQHCEGAAEVLGWEILSEGVVRPKPSRAWRVILSIDWI
mmetsp:Transcript_115608/g.367514  ORF Transcript_115608/g.367514 Transcript_115608/m.367514 type:complete len:112 (+) Transcript_115608:357-692(+)